MKIYYMNISGINPDDEKWQKYLSQKRRDKVRVIKKRENKAQSIGGELLLNFAVNGDIHLPSAWDTDSDGKLYLTEKIGTYVNLSHSGEYAVCAVHDKKIGVDIQLCRECDMKTAQRFFTSEEYDFINGSFNPNAAFFEIWTRKESFVKALGKGLSLGMNTFSVLSDTIEHDGKTYRFKSYKPPKEGYKLSVCYEL